MHAVTHAPRRTACRGCCCCWSLLYIAILRSPADSLRLRVILNSDPLSIVRFLIPTEVVYLQRCLIVTWLMPRETAADSESSVYTIQPCTMSRHFMQSHIQRMHTCLAVTCHLHFWQNDQDLLCATALTRGWNRYRNKIQHRKLIVEKTIIPPFLPFSRPFNHETGALTTELCLPPVDSHMETADGIICT